MHLANRSLLDDFSKLHADAKTHIDTWRGVVKGATWKSPHDVKNTVSKASVVGGKNVFFDIYRDNYRIWTKINYRTGVVLVKAIGTHKEYDKWDIK